MKHLLVTLFIIALLGGSSYAQNINTVAGNGTMAYTGDGTPATSAQLSNPRGIAFDVAGNMYIADAGNNCIRKVSTTGIISTIAGTGIAGSTGDGGPATLAKLNTPYNIAFDHSGNLYVADYVNARIRMITPSGNIYAFAGSGVVGSGGDGGPATAARFSSPTGVAVDASDNVYITDPGNSTVRRVSTSGIITTIAGKVGIYTYTGDGGAATAATLNTPHNIAFDATGNIYVADQYNNCVRMINASGIISTVAGTGSVGTGGDGGPATAATLFSPVSITFDGGGNMYIANYNGEIVRVVDAAHVIHKFAGIAISSGYTGDGIAATASKLYDPYCVALGTNGNIYIADQSNHRIREVILPPCTGVTHGAILSSKGSAFCSTDSTLLSLSVAEAGSSIKYQWQSSPDSTAWTNTGTNTNSYQTGQVDTTWYRLIVTCVAAGISDTTAAYGVKPVKIAPSVAIVASPGTVLKAATTITFTATPVNGGVSPAYQWKKNGINIAAATNAIYIATALSDNDTINCIVHSSEACALPDTATSNKLPIHITTGVNSISAEPDIHLFPNPTDGVFYLTGYMQGMKADVQVTDLVGHIVYSKKIALNDGRIDTNVPLSDTCSNGLYLLSVTTGADSKVLYFLLKRQP